VRFIAEDPCYAALQIGRRGRPAPQEVCAIGQLYQDRGRGRGSTGQCSGKAVTGYRIPSAILVLRTNARLPCSV
jgi:hypothetical protein